MSRKKSLNQFPPEYFAVIEKAALQGVESKITLPDRSKASKLRGHFYAFVATVRTERDRILALQKVLDECSESDQRIVDCATLSFRVLVEMDVQGDGTATLTWKNRDQSWQAIALQGLREVAGTGKEVEVPQFLRDMAVNTTKEKE